MPQTCMQDLIQCLNMPGMTIRWPLRIWSQVWTLANTFPGNVFPASDALKPILSVRVYSHQESPLVHLLWSGPNTMLIFLVWCSSLSHCPFCKWTRNCKQNHSVLRSSIHWFIHSPEMLEAARDHLSSWVSVRMFGPHLSTVFSPAQKICTKGGNELEQSH